MDLAKDLGETVRAMIPESTDLDLQRLLKNIDADVMDIEHKIATAVKQLEKE